MKSAFLNRAFCSVTLVFSLSSFADVNLSVGESTMIDGTKVTCGQTKPAPLHTQTATSKTCSEESLKGECIDFQERTVTGNFCIQGQVCGREAMNGKCVYFNVQAECGEGVCTKQRICGRKKMSGECVYYNESIQCQKAL